MTKEMPQLKRPLYWEFRDNEDKELVTKDYGDSERAKVNSFTAINLASAMSRAAENENYHKLVGTYELIAGLVEKYADADTAKAVMIEIYNKGGFVR